METISPYGAIHGPDVDATITGIAGTFASSDLYTRYSGIATAAGRTPGSQKALGKALRRRGIVRRKVHGRAAWVL